MAMDAKALSLLILGAIMLVGVGVVVAIGASVTQNITGNLVTSNTVTNESITISALTNNTAISLATTSDVTSVTSIKNQTVTIPTQFWTANTAGIVGGTVTPVLPSNYSFADTTWYVTYTQNSPTVASAAASNSTSGLGQLGTQLPSVGLVIGASAILAIIFGVLLVTFRGTGRRE